MDPFDSLVEAMAPFQNRIFKHVRLHGTKFTDALISIHRSLGGSWSPQEALGSHPPSL